MTETAKATTTETTAESESNVTTVEATVIKVGKQRKRRIRQLQRGEGRLAQKVDMTLGQLTSMLGAELEGKKVIPVILVYQEKARRGGKGFRFF